MELGFRQGAEVQPGMTLFQLADLRTVWINAELPEAQTGWIKAGDTTQATVTALPGEHFIGKVDYVYPELSNATRTLKLRVVIDNAAARIRPGMYASVQLQGAAREAALTVPSEALIRTGLRSVVIVADDASHFRPVAVQAGAEVGGRSEIIEGLTEGQNVVASGQFLIDSEASLGAALDRLSPIPEAEHTGHTP
jgi:Cu(I)/Ag(I) efflux system membrane fusion protein